MSDVGTVSPNEIAFGEDLSTQQITYSGAPTSGTFTIRYLDGVTTALNLSDSAATVQTALRLLTQYPACVSAVVTDITNGWSVVSGPDGAFVERFKVSYNMVGGTAPEMAVAITARSPLHYWLKTGERSNGVVSEASVPPSIGRMAIPGTTSDRSSQSKASEWFGRSWLGGLGRLNYRENETVERFWDSGCWTHIDRQITLPALVESETITTLTPMGITAAALGVTANGVRLVAMFDDTGIGTAGTPAYYTASTQTWAIVPAAAPLAANSSASAIIIYQGYVYFGWTKTAANGYVYWDGSGNAVSITTTDGVAVVAWVEWDGKLFRLLSNGKLQWAVPATGVSYIVEADWQPTTTTPTYRGPGYAYALTVFQNLKGEATVWVLATDGLYEYEFDTQRLIRRVQLSGVVLPGAGYYPQANSVATWNGDMVFIQGDTVQKFDGRQVTNLGPAIDDGLPERGISFSQALQPRCLLATNNMLLLGMSKPVENASGTTIASATTISTVTTYYTSLTLTHATDDLTLLADILILDVTDDLGCVLGYNGQGWHTIVPLTQGTTSDARTSRALLFHELVNPPRLMFAPGKFIRWRDKPSNPLFWSDMRYDTSQARWFVTSWFDRDLTDIVKTLLYERIGYRNTGSGSTIIPYYQINNVTDDPNATTGSDPAAHWAPLLDSSGTAITIGDSSADAIAGLIKAFFERDTSPENSSRGQLAYTTRLAFKLATTDSSRSPTLDLFSAPHTGEYDSLFSWSVVFDLSQTSPDGRSPKRQLNDLRATYLSKHVIPVAWNPDEWHYVNMDYFNATGLETGYVVEGERTVVSATLSEVTRF